MLSPPTNVGALHVLCERAGLLDLALRQFDVGPDTPRRTTNRQLDLRESLS